MRETIAFLPRRRLLLRNCLLQVLLLLAVAAAAEESDTDFLYGDRDSNITVERLERKLEWARSKSDIDRETRLERISLYERAIDHLEAYELFRKRQELLEQRLEETESESRQLTRRLQALRQVKVEPDTVVDVAELSIEQLARALRSIHSKEMIAQQSLVRLRRELAAQRQRLVDVRRQLTDTVNRMRESNTSSSSSEPGISPLLAEARRIERRTGQLARQVQARLLTLELNSQSPRLKLLRMRLDLEQLEVGQLEQQGRILEIQLSERRLEKSDKMADEAQSHRQQFKESHPLLRGASGKNEEVSRRLIPLAQAIDASTVRSRELRNQLQQIQANDASIRQKIESANSSAAMSRVIERALRLVPDVETIARELGAGESLAADLMLEMFAFEEQIEALNDVQDFAGRLTDGVGAQGAELAPDAGELDALAVLLRERHTIYLTLLSWTEFYRIQTAQNVHLLGLLDRTLTDFTTYLEERRLWTRSTSSQRVLESIGTRTQGEYNGRYNNRSGLLELLRGSLPLSVNLTPCFLIAIALLLLRAKLGRLLVSTAHWIGDSEHDRFRNTVVALIITILLAAPFALMAGSLALQLTFVPEHTRLSLALEAGFWTLAENIFWIAFVFELCRVNGLADRHFGWDPPMLRDIRVAALWLLIPLVPMGFLNQALGSYFAVESDYLPILFTGMLALIIFSTVFAYYLRDQGAIVAALKTGGHEVAIGRLRWVRFLAFIAAPVILLGLVAFGYSRAALLIGTQIKEGLVVVLGVMIVYETGKRWARLRRGSDDPNYDGSLRLVEALALLLLVLGLLFVWSTTLPALGYLFQIEVWRYNSVIEDKVVVNMVSLADLVLAIVALWLVVFLYRHLPPILHLLLQRFPMDTGNRHTLVTLVLYVLVCLGVGFALSRLGVEWHRFQWLFAALGVGIGFGLREIVANFISGMIIMLERPVRVGDLVTIGNVEGTVSRIRIRATNITTHDHQELLVPNKDFITSSLLNWSLSDQNTRISIRVSVPFRSDLDKTMELIMRQAKADPLVLTQPAPFVTCEDFGNDSIELCLRFFMNKMDERLETRSRLIQGIKRAFIEAGIDLALPQRDVHLETSQPLKVELQPPSIP